MGWTQTVSLDGIALCQGPFWFEPDTNGGSPRHDGMSEVSMIGIDLSVSRAFSCTCARADGSVAFRKTLSSVVIGTLGSSGAG